MIDANPKQTTAKSDGTVLRGIFAQFADLQTFKSAAKTVSEHGYRRWETYTPFPVHGLDEIQNISPTRLPWLVLAGGLFGGLGALILQWWTNAVDYPFIISGKPLFSLPANIPVAFEVAILSAAIAALMGMLIFNRLPKFSDELLNDPQFQRVTSDRFVIAIDADDPRFDRDHTRAQLLQLGALTVESLDTQQTDSRLPRPVKFGLAALGVLALIPPLLIARARATTSEKPPIHLVQDMDSQSKFKAQTPNSFFADGRSMRPPVAGTIARGELNDERFTRGVQPGTNDWLRQIPLPVTTSLMERGRQRYNIFCATCHGRAGDGDGLVTLRALELEQGTWVKPAALHTEAVAKQRAGQLFNTITNGVRKMPGYASQIPQEDRWAIVLYLRALQRSRNATLKDVPAELRSTLRDTN